MFPRGRLGVGLPPRLLVRDMASFAMEPRDRVADCGPQSALGSSIRGQVSPGT